MKKILGIIVLVIVVLFVYKNFFVKKEKFEDGYNIHTPSDLFSAMPILHMQSLSFKKEGDIHIAHIKILQAEEPQLNLKSGDRIEFTVFTPKMKCEDGEVKCFFTGKIKDISTDNTILNIQVILDTSIEGMHDGISGKNISIGYIKKIFSPNPIVVPMEIIRKVDNKTYICVLKNRELIRVRRSINGIDTPLYRFSSELKEVELGETYNMPVDFRGDKPYYYVELKNFDQKQEIVFQGPNSKNYWDFEC